MSDSQRPIISKGESGTWWCVTRYHMDLDNNIKADEKWDITEIVETIIKESINVAMHPALRTN